MAERKLKEIPLGERIATNDTESPRMSQVWLLYYISEGKEIPERVLEKTVWAAIRERSVLRTLLLIWNDSLASGMFDGENIGVRWDMATKIGLKVCESFGIDAPKHFKGRMGYLSVIVNELGYELSEE